MTERFSRDILYSVLGHGTLLLLIFFRAVLVPQEHLDVSNAIRVDVVGLPKKMQEQKLEPPAPVAPAPEPPKPATLPPKVAQEPAKPIAPVMPKKLDHSKTEKQAIDKLKAMEAMESFKKETTATKIKPTIKMTATVVAGNRLAQGNSLTGLEKIEYDRYFDQIKTKIDGQWSIPQWLADADLKAQVLVVVDEHGFIVKKQFRKSSGNDIFDAKVMEALETSSPLPPPPERLKGLLSTSGIVLNFPR
jgi:colicin import membrane protein